MKALFLTFYTLLSFLAGQPSVSWDKTIHDFGDVSVTDGPLSCTFTLTNDGEEPLAIFEVVSSCGCTDVKWTREPILPGKKGTIQATYKNEDGPMPFDKTLTVYVAGIKKPVILRLRGVVHEKKRSLAERYGAERLGALGLKSRQLKSGTLRQGQQSSEAVTVANLGSRPLKVGFANVSEGLRMRVEPNPIPAGATATLHYTVSAREGVWGKNTYTATPTLNGKPAAAPLEVVAWTQADFSSLTDAQRRTGPIPMFQNSTVNFGNVSKGQRVQIEFKLENKGKSPLVFYKADSESAALRCVGPLPQLPPGGKATLMFSLDTSSLQAGENVIMLSLTTNSPLRPLVNLFVAGQIR